MRHDYDRRRPNSPGTRFSRFKRFAPYLLLGPISGPLTAAMVHHFRNGRPVLATLYGIALVEIIILLPYINREAGASSAVAARGRSTVQPERRASATPKATSHHISPGVV